MSYRAFVLVVLAACHAGPRGDDMQQADADADAMPMSAIDATPGCTPLGPCEWLDSYQRHIIGVLAGVEDVSPGVRLAHRESVGERSATRQFLLDAFAALGVPAQRQDYTTGSFTGANIIARLDTASESTGTLIIGAHFDGVAAGPAAADNATGVAIALSLARYLRDVPARKHDVIIALFDQEELGLVGSREYVKTVTASAVRGAHIFDMVSFDGDGDHAVELWSPSPSLQALYELHGPAAGTPISAVPFELSDHQAFVEAGITVVGVSEEFVGGDHTPHYHKATDTYANISFDYLARVTRLAFDVLDAEVR